MLVTSVYRRFLFALFSHFFPAFQEEGRAGFTTRVQAEPKDPREELDDVKLYPSMAIHSRVWSKERRAWRIASLDDKSIYKILLNLKPRTGSSWMQSEKEEDRSKERIEDAVEPSRKLVKSLWFQKSIARIGGCRSPSAGRFGNRKWIEKWR